ncbi:arylsulfatase A-like enzyme [Neolewinella xylanilytica]|uniref:Arylsulfatase A-like enzyme n=1 Tax=Neolewinella xylanilytica TaxID=1514080 RepID=A0A2S6I3W2_9BACT|nr:arylsulfatase [Neolewinella xylanilytica]PPK85749.1 arylsulfatase A-like enzyme [Neolewinella xylanilytica]
MSPLHPAPPVHSQQNIARLTQRTLIYHFLPLVAVLFACGGHTDTDSTASDRPSPPNIIYILADDLGYGDLSCYGQTLFDTPNIDRLAANGLRFTQHYSGSTVCAPSRSALMTGLHTGHTFIRGNKEVHPEGQWPLPDRIRVLPEMLRDQGYRTGAFGKWGLGYPGSEGDPVRQGFDTFYGYNCQRLAHHYYPYYLWDNQERDSLPANAGTAKGSYAPTLIQDRTLAFIEENRDRPFFLYYAQVIPHAELAAPDSLVTRFAEQFGPEKAWQGTDSGSDYRRGSYESAERPHATFAAMITLLDQHVGEIQKKLEELGLTENTLIIFTSDNGPHTEGGADPDFFDSNGPLRGYKRDLYEGGIRVPMIAAMPGTVPVGETDHVSAFWDVLPTLADLSGARVPEGLDGISFLPTLGGGAREQQRHEYLYWEFHERGGRQAIRQGDWKGVRYNAKTQPNTPLELYDLAGDPGETQNVAAQHPEVVLRLDSLLKASRYDSEVFPWVLADGS